MFVEVQVSRFNALDGEVIARSKKLADAVFKRQSLNTYTYEAYDVTRVGDLVIVPWGRGNKLHLGKVIQTTPSYKLPALRDKKIRVKRVSRSCQYPT